MTSLVPRNGSIRTRILVGFVIAGLLPLIGVLVVSETRNREALRKSEFQKIHELGEEAVRQIAGVMSRAAAELDGIATNPILADPAQTVEIKLQEMTRLVEAHRFFHGLTLFSSSGFFLGSTVPNHAGERDRSRWLRKATRSGLKSITSPHRVIGEEGLFLTVYIPLGESSEPKQVATARFPFLEIERIVQHITPGKDGEVVLIDEFGNQLAGQDRRDGLSRFDAAIPAGRWLEEEKGYYQLRGRRSFFTSHFLSPLQTKVGRPWTLLCFEPLDEVNDLLMDSRMTQLQAGAFGLILACALGLYISRRISKPIERASTAAHAINLGDFDVKMPEEGPREIRQLAASFNRMIEDLHHYRDDMEATVAARTKSLHEIQETLKKERASLANRVEMRTRELRAANKELARSARMKDEFLAGMSHELRTPLNAVLGLAESLTDGTYGELNKQQTSKLRIIDESGRHLLSLINDILDVAKVEAGEMHLDITEVSISDLSESCINLLKQSASKKNLSLKSTIDPAAVSLHADARRLKQILVNLLSNAVKFTSTGSVGLDITASREDRTMSFVVWDTGIGIPEDQIDRLFQPFVQLDSGLERQYEGTGLGLALVYNFTEIHGGSVSAESKPNQGTRITVTIPWRDSEEFHHNSHPGVLLAKGVCLGKLLLVDDNETERLHLAQQLNRQGYEIHLAQDGASAIEQARQIEPALILMDVQMPGMDGLEATHHLRGEPAFQNVPIIGLTALNTPSDIRRIHDAGMSDCVLKPACVLKLVNILDFHLGKTSRRKRHRLDVPAA